MDTDKLNRELQIFRNHVKIARENIVHKLVRDIRLWKGKQQTNPDGGRATRKVQSLEQLLTHIRSQPAPELAKAVIKFNRKEVGLQGQDLTLEQRGLMRFHGNKKLQPEVKALIRRFGLKDKMELLDKYLKDKGEGRKGKRKGKAGKKKVVLGGTEGQESEDQGFCEAEKKTKDEVSISGPEVSNDEDNAEEVGKFVRITPTKVTKEKSPKKNPKRQKRKKEFKAPEEEDSEDKCVQIQDSFFVTSSGQSYVATAPVIDKKQEQDEEEFSWKRANKRKDIFGNQEEKPQKRFSSEQQKNGHKSLLREKPKDQRSDDLHPSWAAKQKQKGFQPFSGKKTVFDAPSSEPSKTVEPGADLHPSWAAKQQQKGIKPFAGKKVVFDLEESVPVSSENLHPSWAAKQKQKGIKAFQGKRMVFDVEEPPKESPADLHPSWAAKQREKGIKAFQGKKITFDN